MSSSVSLIAKYLGAEKQAELALNLSTKLQEHPENIHALNDLIEGLDINDSLYSNLFAYVSNIIFNVDLHTEDNFKNVLKTINRVPQVRTDLLKKIILTINNFINSNINNFIPEFQKLVKESKDTESDPLANPVSNVLVLTLFKFLDFLFMNSDPIDDDSIDSILLMFLGINDDNLSNIVSKLLRWRIGWIAENTKDSSTVWDLILSLYHTSEKTHMTHAFILWLRYLDTQDFKNNATFQQMVQDEKYWRVIQDGFISNSHDHRKFCLSILQLSVKSINTSFTNTFITWDCAKNKLYLKEWERYVTMFEIMGIDTSLHQAQACASDIISLISPRSLIPPSWGFCLLSTGFKASMDSVRKFTLNLLLSIPFEHLYLIKHGLSFLQDVYLPYAMVAAHFAVRPKDGVQKCEHGERLTKFITNLLIHLKTDQEYEDVTLTILNVMKESFDPARIYVSLGIAQALSGKYILKFGNHDKPLLRLFETRCEGELFEITSQTINLRILLSFKFEVAPFFEVLNKFVKFNGYKLVKEHLPLVKKYLEANGFGQDQMLEYLSDETPDDYKVFLVGLIDNNDILVEAMSSKSIKFLAKVIETGFELPPSFKEPRILALYKDVFSSTSNVDINDHELFTILSKANFVSCPYLIPQKSQIVDLWSSIYESIQSDNYYVLGVALEKYRLFNSFARYCQVPFDTFNELMDFHNNMLKNTGELTKTVKDFYKLKDQIHGEFFATLEIYSEKGLFEEIDVSDLLSLMNSSSSNYRANFSMVKLLNNYVKANENISKQVISKIVEFLTDLWVNLDSSRLQLNQKELHILTIDTLFDFKILSGTNNDFSDKYLAFCLSVIENSKGRRSILPYMTKKMSEFQISNPESFQELVWVPEVLVRSSIMYQLRSNAFKLEGVVGKLFDQSLAFTPNYDIYNVVYGPEEITSKINLLAILNSIKSRDFATKIFSYIVENDDQFALFEEINTIDGYEEWIRIQLFSVIVSIIDKIEIGTYLSGFIELFKSETSPLARVYIEWIVAFGLLNDEAQTNILFEQLLNNIAAIKPSIITSFERSLFLMIQQLSSTQEVELLTKFITVIIPGATSNKALVRHFSTSLIVSAYEEVVEKKLKIEKELFELIQNMHQVAVQSEAYGQHRNGDALIWNIKNDLTLVSVSGGLLLRVSDREDIDFVLRDDFLKHLSDAQVETLNHPIGEDFRELWIKERRQYTKQVINTEPKTQSPLQTKSGAWNTIMDVDQKSRGSDVVRSDLIVVSSLVDKPPNLGGICRLCDVLGAGLLTLNDINVKNHAQFKTVAVTADSWMPMVEVKADAIKTYLKEKKIQGYTLIGLEQTDKSVELNSELKFPKKSLILIGREKEGVPGDLLAELDFCVEIKQVGVIRSMNIQTATAIIVHAYSTQHC
jgi:tRNA guanosine-2'-O-methyltransferase